MPSEAQAALLISDIKSKKTMLFSQFNSALCNSKEYLTTLRTYMFIDQIFNRAFSVTVSCKRASVLPDHNQTLQQTFLFVAGTSAANVHAATSHLVEWSVSAQTDTMSCFFGFLIRKGVLLELVPPTLLTIFYPSEPIVGRATIRIYH